MEQKFIDILKTVVEKHGKEYLLEMKKCKAIVSDYAGSEFRIEKSLLLRAVEAGASKAISSADEDSLGSCIKAQQRELHEEQFMDETLALNIVNILAHVLRGMDLVLSEAGKDGGSDNFDEAVSFYNENQFDKAMPMLLALAEKGHIGAQRIYGESYMIGSGVEKDQAKAIEWWRKAAEQGDGRANSWLGLCYKTGTGVEKDLSKAIELLHKAAAQDDDEAQYRLGCLYEEGEGVEQDYAKAAEWYKKAGKWMHNDAMFNLGYFYEKGMGVERDYSEAQKWYFFAAEQGHESAQSNLAYLYYRADLYEKSVEFYRKYAEQGFAMSQFGLGTAYAEGKGVEQDLAKSAEWMRKAAVQGHAAAQFCLGFCYENGNGVPQSYGQAFEWYTKAAEQGNADGQCSVGWAYSQGQGVTQDYAKAIEWYRKAADQGNCAAYNNLGDCYIGGTGVEKDEAKAVTWWRKSAEKGDDVGQNNLGWCYMHGHGVPKDNAIAIEWLEKSAAQGNERAKEKLDKLKSAPPPPQQQSAPKQTYTPPKQTYTPPPQYSSSVSVSDKNWYILVALSILLGWLGADRFYAGRWGLGILKLLSMCIGIGVIWWVIDIVLALTGKQEDEYEDCIEPPNGKFKIFGILIAIVIGAVALSSVAPNLNLDNIVNSAKNLIAEITGSAPATPTAEVFTPKVATVTSKTLVLYAEQSPKSKNLKTLKKGDAIVATGKDVNGWTPVRAGNLTGWVLSSLIEVKK
jgi:TPR repeat protein